MSCQSDATAYMSVMGIGQAWARALNFEIDVPAINRQPDECNAKKADTRVFRLLSPKTRRPMSAERWLPRDLAEGEGTGT